MNESFERTDYTPAEELAYRITYFRNAEGPCSKQDATEVIIHEYNKKDELVDCRFRYLEHA